MSTFIYITGAVTAFLLVFNIWAKSLLIGIATIILILFMIFRLPEPVVALDYYPMGAGYLVLFAECLFLIYKTENW